MAAATRRRTGRQRKQAPECPEGSCQRALSCLRWWCGPARISPSGKYLRLRTTDALAGVLAWSTLSPRPWRGDCRQPNPVRPGVETRLVLALPRLHTCAKARQGPTCRASRRAPSPAAIIVKRRPAGKCVRDDSRDNLRGVNYHCRRQIQLSPRKDRPAEVRARD